MFRVSVLHCVPGPRPLRRVVWEGEEASRFWAAENAGTGVSSWVRPQVLFPGESGGAARDEAQAPAVLSYQCSEGL